MREVEPERRVNNSVGPVGTLPEYVQVGGCAAERSHAQRRQARRCRSFPVQGRFWDYRSIRPFYAAAGAFSGLTIRQPSFYLVGEVDALEIMRRTIERGLRPRLPGLRGFVELPGVGHWPNRAAPDEYHAALLGFLSGL